MRSFWTAAAAVVLVSACTGSATPKATTATHTSVPSTSPAAVSPSPKPSPVPKPLTLTQAQATLLAVPDVSEGWSVQPQKPPPAPKLYCGKAEPVRPVVRVRRTYLNGSTDRVASETLRSYQSVAQAAAYVAAMKASLDRCPAEGVGKDRATLAETNLRTYGDESFAVTSTYPDSTVFYAAVVRVGTDALYVSASDDIDELKTFTQAAVDKLARTRSG